MDEQDWLEWLAYVMTHRPNGNMYLESPRGIEVTKLCLDKERKDFSWRRSDKETFWVDVQLYVKYNLDDNDILFIMEHQPGVDNYSKFADERHAYSEMMRGIEKLKNIEKEKQKKRGIKNGKD